jgi:hypothetical protein
VIALILFAVKYFSVIVHEGAHAIAGWSMGRKVASVKLNSDATGATRTLGAERGLGRIFTAFAGYLGPSFFGLGAAALISMGYARAVLWLALFLLTLILFRVRNLFGVASVLVNGALFVLILSHGSPKLQSLPPMFSAGSCFCLESALFSRTAATPATQPTCAGSPTFPGPCGRCFGW